MSNIGTAWRFVLRRAAADKLILVAALITVMLATVLLASGPIYADAVTLSALQRTIDDLPPDDANIEIAIRVSPQRYAEAETVVATEVGVAFSEPGGDLVRTLTSEAYQLPIRSTNGQVAIGMFHVFQDIENHATLSDGAWPTTGTSEVIETALSLTVAQRLGLEVGDEITVTNRRNPEQRQRVALTGTYVINSSTDEYWFGDPLAIEGFETSASFDTFGPFVVDFEALLIGLNPRDVQAGWRVFPAYEDLAITDITTLQTNVSLLEDALNNSVDDQILFRVDTPLDRILLDTEQSLIVTRSGVLMLSLQLAALAGLALALTAGLLADSRRVETDLLRSRGAGPRHVLSTALLEGALLTFPAAVIAPWLAVKGVSLLNSIGPLASIGLTLDPVTTTSAYVLALLAAAGCTLALAAPAYRSARSFNEAHVRRGREMATSRTQRTGIDLAILTVAAIAIWQLSVHGESITTAVQQRLGIDPLLVSAPVLGLLAGSVLALRIVPMLARLADSVARGVRSPVSALAAWQVARRPRRFSRSALLLIIAISIGILAAGYTSVWTQSQDDQAAFQVGADIQVFPDRRTGAAIADIHVRDTHVSLEGISNSMPLVRGSGGGSGDSAIRRFVMLDAAQAADVVDIRDDIGPGFAAAMEALAAGRPELTTLPLPGEPARFGLEFDVEVAELPDPVDENAPRDSICFCPSVQVVFQDGADLLHRVDLGDLAVDSGSMLLTTDLHALLRDGSRARPTYPLSLVNIEMRSPTPLDASRTATINFRGVHISDSLDGPMTNITPSLNPSSWNLGNTFVPGALTQPTVGVATAPDGGLEFEVETGRVSGVFLLPTIYSIRPIGTNLPKLYPVVLSENLATETGLGLGDELRLTGLRIERNQTEFAGTIEKFPTVDPGSGEVVILDLPTIQMVSYEPGREIEPIDEYWLASADDEAAAAASSALRSGPIESARVVDKADVAGSMKSDPVALGVIGSLAFGFVAAAVFAAVGFAVSATVSARERTTEFALLRALGLSTRQLGRWLSVEQGVLVATSLLLGTLMGWLLSWLVLPLISVTQDGALPIPTVVVAYPWGTIFWLELSVIASLGAIVAVMSYVNRRLGIGSLLRMGED